MKKVEAKSKLKAPKNTKDLKSVLGALQVLAEFLPKLSEKTDRLRKLLKKKEPLKWENEQEEIFIQIKRILTKKPCLGHYAKDKTLTKTRQRRHKTECIQEQISERYRKKLLHR